MGFKVNINDRPWMMFQGITETISSGLDRALAANSLAVDISANALTRKAVREFGDSLQNYCKNFVEPVAELKHAEKCGCAVCFMKRCEKDSLQSYVDRTW